MFDRTFILGLGLCIIFLMRMRWVYCEKSEEKEDFEAKIVNMLKARENIKLPSNSYQLSLRDKKIVNAYELYLKRNLNDETTNIFQLFLTGLHNPGSRGYSLVVDDPYLEKYHLHRNIPKNKEQTELTKENIKEVLKKIIGDSNSRKSWHDKGENGNKEYKSNDEEKSDKTDDKEKESSDDYGSNTEDEDENGSNDEDDSDTEDEDNSDEKDEDQDQNEDENDDENMSADEDENDNKDESIDKDDAENKSDEKDDKDNDEKESNDEDEKGGDKEEGESADDESGTTEAEEPGDKTTQSPEGQGEGKEEGESADDESETTVAEEPGDKTTQSPEENYETTDTEESGDKPTKSPEENDKSSEGAESEVKPTQAPEGNYEPTIRPKSSDVKAYLFNTTKNNNNTTNKTIDDTKSETKKALEKEFEGLTREEIEKKLEEELGGKEKEGGSGNDNEDKEKVENGTEEESYENDDSEATDISIEGGDEDEDSDNGTTEEDSSEKTDEEGNSENGTTEEEVGGSGNADEDRNSESGSTQEEEGGAEEEESEKADEDGNSENGSTEEEEGIADNSKEPENDSEEEEKGGEGSGNGVGNQSPGSSSECISCQSSQEGREDNVKCEGYKIEIPEGTSEDKSKNLTYQYLNNHSMFIVKDRIQCNNYLQLLKLFFRKGYKMHKEGPRPNKASFLGGVTCRGKGATRCCTCHITKNFGEKGKAKGKVNRRSHTIKLTRKLYEFYAKVLTEGTGTMRAPNKNYCGGLRIFLKKPEKRKKVEENMKLIFNCPDTNAVKITVKNKFNIKTGDCTITYQSIPKDKCNYEVQYRKFLPNLK